MHRIFGFSIDACASAANALLPRYWTAEDDAFAHDWTGERVYCNPPFKRSRDAMRKAREAKVAVVITCVTTISNLYMHEHAPGHIFLPRRRWQYLPPIGLVGPSSNPIPTLALLYGATTSHVRRLRKHGITYRVGP